MSEFLNHKNIRCNRVETCSAWFPANSTGLARTARGIWPFRSGQEIVISNWFENRTWEDTLWKTEKKSILSLGQMYKVSLMCSGIRKRQGKFIIVFNTWPTVVSPLAPADAAQRWKWNTVSQGQGEGFLLSGCLLRMFFTPIFPLRCGPFPSHSTAQKQSLSAMHD